MDSGHEHAESERATRASVQRLLRLCADAGVALMLVVIASSAFLRLEQAGLSCADWPACYGRVDPGAAASTGVIVARLAHRIAAGVVGTVLLAALLIGAAQRPMPKRQVAIVVVALVVALGLAALGARFPATSAAIPLPPVIMANLGGGFTLFALLWALRLATLAPPRPQARAWLAGIAVIAVVALIAQIMLGALVSAKFAARSCPAFPLCGADWPAGALFASLDPFASRVVGSDGTIARPVALAALHWAHRVGALVVFVLGAAVTASLLRIQGKPRTLGAFVAALLAAQLALGASVALAPSPLIVAVAHNAVAALLLVALVTAAWALVPRSRIGAAHRRRRTGQPARGGERE